MSTSGTNRSEDNTLAQADANLMTEFEQTGEIFNYSRSVLFKPTVSTDTEIRAYLGKIERGGHIQSFGCMLVVQEPTYKIIAYGENIFDILGLRNLEEVPHEQIMSLIGMDARTLFTPSSWDSLSEINPILVISRGNSKSFYAIPHKIDVGVIIDLELAYLGDPTASTLLNQKLATEAISRLQMITSSDISVLCDIIVQEVQHLTGYDRVMVYKFHEDNHGEVVSEIRKPELESFLGVHYPATDIPIAARFLFNQNPIRMIYDCRAPSVRVIQSEALSKPVCLGKSILRASHQCHAQYMSNMGSIASLVMAIRFKNKDDSRKLWGLVVCHHTSPRYCTVSLRCFCEFLIQSFSVQLQLVLQIEAQMEEKNVLRVLTLLSDMLLRGAPPAIMIQSPNIMDLVKCDGAALYYGGKCWFLDATPTESQLQDIIKWLLLNMLDGSSSGLRTDSLVQAGYPGAAELGDAVCGMAAARLTALNFVFWFRSNTAKELKWGGARHEPDDGGKMQSRTSFQAYLEEAKHKSLPWEAAEMDAIYSLLLMMRESLKKIEEGTSSKGSP